MLARISSIIGLSLSLFLVAGAAHAASEWSAEPASHSHNKIYIEPERDMTVTASFKNTGTKTWRGNAPYYGYVALNVRAKSQFEHRFWYDWEHPCIIQQNSVAPGEVASCRFAFKAPSTIGEHVLTLELASERVAWIEGGKLEIPVITTLDPAGAKAEEDRILREEEKRRQQLLQDAANAAAAEYAAEQTTTVTSANANLTPVEKVPEPLDFRVGLFYRTTPLQLTNWGTYHMTDPNGNILATYGAGTIITVQYQNGQYNVSTPAGTKTYSHYVRFVSAEDNTEGIFELTNYDTRPAWNPNINENKYRGIIEYRHNPKTGNIWTINELPLETYMKGIGEIGERAPMDALKASAVAARGYALDLYQKNTKYGGFIHAITTQSDQLFGGYEQEIRRPNFQQAVEETRGQVITYEGKAVVSPYFSQSKGETRSSQEIWGGPHKPWLVRVSVPCDVGQRGLGHGVGMSQQASICMALDGMKYQPILEHFYTGIKVGRVY